jgi:hypothetical protein
LNCYSREAHEHTDVELKLLQTVARLVGVAAETAIIAERQRETAAEIGRLSEALTQRNAELSDLIQAQVELALALVGSGDAAEAICRILSDRLGAAVMICGLDGMGRAYTGPDAARPLIAQTVTRKGPLRLATSDDGSLAGLCSVHRIGKDPALGLVLIYPALQAPAHAKTVFLKHALALLAFELETERSDRAMRDFARPNVLTR